MIVLRQVLQVLMGHSGLAATRACIWLSETWINKSHSAGGTSPRTTSASGTVLTE
jgi:hypothetical protein